MRLPRVQLGEATLLWLGVFGAPAAWAVQHIAGFSLTEARCREAATIGGWSLDMDAWTIAVTALAAIVAVTAIGAAIVTFRGTRGAEEPPRERIHFLAVIGITIGPLFLAMILMSGLGAVFLPQCVQS
ncbi:MAG TPA: hypothetical protein VFM58_16735 [Solirubrobacteraceae bacterium]|nr:hypothetical protein [Solirubrobacteraceae bacterium]